MSPLPTSTVKPETDVNLIFAWTIAGIGMVLACLFLVLFLYMKCKDSCRGCSRLVSASPSDIASIYRQNNRVDCDHEYERITLQDQVEENESVCNSEQSPTDRRPGGERAEDYINPRASSSTDHVLDDARISRLSHLLSTSFWSETKSEGFLESKSIPTRGSYGQKRTQSCRKVKSDDVCSDSLTAGHFVPDSGEFRAQRFPAGIAETKSPVTDSMVDIFQEIFKPSNSNLRSLLLKTVRPTTETNESLSRRLSKSETDVNMAKLSEAFGDIWNDPFADRQIKPNADDDHYVAVADIRITPKPKQRKSLSRKGRSLDAKQTESELDIQNRKLPDISVLQCNTIPCSLDKRVPVPLPRCKPMNPSQYQPCSILKTSCNKIEGDESVQDGTTEANLRAPSMPLDNLDQNQCPRSNNAQQVDPPGYGSLRRSVQKVKKAICLDGHAKTGKEHLNVRMVVTDLACSAENVGLDSEFWSS
ncbi:uncharacterized protein LOC125382124 [Haliotis rufescens]|uniref:uncharacterized protein LOC125382124 n=1 Tax=Haliotis rufescens TaxID=6454 RepID=UPI00201E8FAD|nr:uncharacterized protein LOC125382124 [Haliotis rufescens]